MIDDETCLTNSEVPGGGLRTFDLMSAGEFEEFHGFTGVGGVQFFAARYGEFSVRAEYGDEFLSLVNRIVEGWLTLGSW